LSKSFKYLKVLGERNCGTNYLEQLWTTNFKIQILTGVPHRRVPFKRFEWTLDLFFFLSYGYNLGWKHAMAPSVKMIKNNKKFGEIGFISIVKNPYSFLLSLYKRPYQFIGNPSNSFNEFLISPWKTTRREHWPRGYFNNPIELWNQKNRSYLQLTKELPDLFLILKYEDLLQDPEVALGRIATKFRLSMDGFNNVKASTKNDEGKSFHSYQEYYLSEKWKEDLDAESLELINKNLDMVVLNSLGYEKVE
jgi:hypothetical protein